MVDVIEDVRNEFKVKVTDKLENEINNSKLETIILEVKENKFLKRV